MENAPPIAVISWYLPCELNDTLANYPFRHFVLDDSDDASLLIEIKLVSSVPDWVAAILSTGLAPAALLAAL